MKNFSHLKLFGVIACLVLASSCGKKNDDEANSEMSQQIGDIMASMDESSGSNTGDIALRESRAADKLFTRIAPKSNPLNFLRKGFDKAIPSAEAVSCLLSPGFGACAANTIIRNFNSCTIGAAVLSGTVTLAWGGGAANCMITANGQTITRTPNFNISGRFGGSLVVSKTGTVGQLLTRTSAGVFQFTNDGIRRVVALNGTSLYDFTTTTTGTGLTVSGVLRNGRTLTAAANSALRVTNNITNTTCDFVPTAVTWSNTCNCAVSGSWSGTCSDGKTASVQLSGCGNGTFTMNGESTSVSFDRCYGT